MGMTGTVRIDLGPARATWFRMPATTEEPHESETVAGSLGVSFTAHPRALVERASGRLDEIIVPPNAAFVTGNEPFSWVRVSEPYEGVEIELDDAFVHELADTYRAPDGAHMDNRILAEDAVFWSVAVRLREHALGRRHLEPLEGETLVRTLLAHVLCEHFGGRPARRNMRTLDARRLSTLVDYVEANLAEQLSLARLAAVASMSPHYFHEAFRRATGLTPHVFVTARRVERARALLAKGHTREQAARQVGYTAGHAFRRAMKNHGGASVQ